jgi:hypothetical protein
MSGLKFDGGYIVGSLTWQGRRNDGEQAKGFFNYPRDPLC